MAFGFRKSINPENNAQRGTNDVERGKESEGSERLHGGREGDAVEVPSEKGTENERGPRVQEGTRKENEAVQHISRRQHRGLEDKTWLLDSEKSINPENNAQRGVTSGKEETNGLNRGAESGTFTSQSETRTKTEDRSRIQEALGETQSGSSEQVTGRIRLNSEESDDTVFQLISKHRQRLKTDPEFRKEMEPIQKWVAKFLVPIYEDSKTPYDKEDEN